MNNNFVSSKKRRNTGPLEMNNCLYTLFTDCLWTDNIIRKRKQKQTKGVKTLIKDVTRVFKVYGFLNTYTNKLVITLAYLCVKVRFNKKFFAYFQAFQRQNERSVELQYPLKVILWVRMVSEKFLLMTFRDKHPIFAGAPGITMRVLAVEILVRGCVQRREYAHANDVTPGPGALSSLYL